MRSVASVVRRRTMLAEHTAARLHRLLELASQIECRRRVHVVLDHIIGIHFVQVGLIDLGAGFQSQHIETNAAAGLPRRISSVLISRLSGHSSNLPRSMRRSNPRATSLKCLPTYPAT